MVIWFKLQVILLLKLYPLIHIPISTRNLTIIAITCFRLAALRLHLSMDLPFQFVIYTIMSYLVSEIRTTLSLLPGYNNNPLSVYPIYGLYPKSHRLYLVHFDPSVHLVFPLFLQCFFLIFVLLVPKCSLWIFLLNCIGNVTL